MRRDDASAGMHPASGATTGEPCQGMELPLRQKPEPRFDAFTWHGHLRLKASPTSPRDVDELKSAYNAALELIAQTRDVAAGVGTVLSLLAQEERDDDNRDTNDPNDRPMFGVCHRDYLGRLAECASDLLLEKTHFFFDRIAIDGDRWDERASRPR